ncbi:MAG TPA: spermidine/putrescine ABC transporter substrate-binding protein [Thermoanaerobaculia bacterium]|nr:spermidine/putrescine ABC transporter substrate-binding protein [Thermoanaerobaculia bacterium]
MPRRSFLTLALFALAPAVALLAACGGEQAAPPQKLVVYMWSEYIDPAIPEAFTKETGIEVKIDVYEATEDMEAKIKQGADSQYDLLVVSDHAVPVLAEQGLLQPLDRGRIPNAGNVADLFVDPPYDRGSRYSLPYQWGTVGVIYRKDKLGEAPLSWSLLFDPAAQKGPFLLIDSMRDMLGVAQKAAGGSVNGRDPALIQAAGERVLKAKKTPRFVGFEGGVGGKNKVLAGSADFAIVYNGDALRGLEEDEGLGFAVPSEGSIVWVDAMVIPKRAPNPDAAHRFIEFLLRPEIGAQLSNFNRYPTPNEAAMPFIAEADRNDPAVYPPPEVMAKLEYLEDVGEATRLYDEVWTAVKAR